MKVTCATWGTRAPASVSLAVQGVRRALLTAGPLPAGELHLVWTTRVRLRQMNRRFRRTDRFTDVISFRYETDTEDRSRPYGDLYIAVDQARLNARRFGVTAREEIVRLAVHGALHLLGYTDYTPAARRCMWAVQEPIVQSLLGRSPRRPRG